MVSNREKKVGRSSLSWKTYIKTAMTESGKRRRLDNQKDVKKRKTRMVE